MKIYVNTKELDIKSAETILTGEINAAELEFEFSSEWASLEKVAVFSTPAKTYREAIRNNKCAIPCFEVSGKIVFGVYGYVLSGEQKTLQYSPAPIYINVKQGSFAEATEQESISPTDFERYTNQFREWAKEEGLSALGDTASKLLCTPDSYTIAASAEEGNLNIVQLMNDSIRVIEKKAFKDCKNLKIVSSNSVQMMQESAFEGCESLISTFMWALLFIPDNAFKNCFRLEKNKFENADSVGVSAFEGCTSLVDFDCILIKLDENRERDEILKKVNFKEKDLSPEDRNKLDKLKRKNNRLINISNWAFKNCVNLESFTINDKTALAYDAFEGCVNLESIIMLGRVALFEKTTFADDEDIKILFNYDDYKFPSQTIVYVYEEDFDYYKTSPCWQALYNAGRIKLISEMPGYDNGNSSENTENTGATENESGAESTTSESEAQDDD